MSWISVLVFYLAVSAILGVAGSRLGRGAVAVALAPFLVHLGVVAATAMDAAALPAYESLTWVPALGIGVGFEIDRISLLLAGLVAGIGTLIVFYSWRYFGDGPRLVRFLALLVLFTAGMAGIVISDELFGLFLFWEITTVASYLLIGFQHESADARDAALKAVLITTAGGLAMLAGFVVIAAQSGTTSISALAQSPPTGPAVSIGLVLVLIGAFTKSAQVPFHFWLPGAMAAPAPASAYLHSATMVKAGVVLLVLLAPAFASSPVWTPLVTAIGLVTMATGAVSAIGQNDLKLLLAYSTVSQLGFMTALIGLGLVGAAVAVLFAHAIFKAGLFLVVGVVDKKTGTRDVRRLAGLGRRTPALAGVALVLTLSMAGLPPALGFVTKEAAFDVLIGGGEWAALGIIALASVATVVYSARFWFGAFGGRDRLQATPVEPGSDSMGVAPGILAVLTLALGLAPGWLGGVLADGTGQAVKLVLWPGFTPALGVSAAVVSAGAVAAVLQERIQSFRMWDGATVDGVYRAMLAGLARLADRVTGRVQSGSLPVYLATIMVTVVTVPLVVWLVGWGRPPSLPIANGIAEVALALTAVVAALGAARVDRRLAAVLLLGVAGYSIAGIYVVYGAPDLALTQLLIETLTVALFALVLVRLPRRFGDEPRSLSRRARLAVSTLVGAFAAVAAIVITSVTPDRSVANTYIAEAPTAGGSNVVNIILTNFRALDTLGEITVLAGAALGISALVRARRGKEVTP